METRRIGFLEVSVVGMGCNNFGRRLDADATSDIVHVALDAGITFFDTADVYGDTQSEEFLGRALGRRRARRGARHEVRPRDRRGTRGRQARVRATSPQVQPSPPRDGSHRPYQLHSPDPEVPIEDTLRALDELVRAGKVREIGCSYFSADLLREAEEAARDGSARFASAQNEYSLLHRDPEHNVSPRANVRTSRSSPISRWPTACSRGSTGKAGPHRGESPPVLQNA